MGEQRELAGNAPGDFSPPDVDMLETRLLVEELRRTRQDYEFPLSARKVLEIIDSLIAARTGYREATALLDECERVLAAVEWSGRDTGDAGYHCCPSCSELDPEDVDIGAPEKRQGRLSHRADCILAKTLYKLRARSKEGTP